MNRWLTTIIGTFLLSSALALADDDLPLAVFVDAGDTEGLIEAINKSNDGTGPGLIFVRSPRPGGPRDFVFDNSDGTALPLITSNVEIYPVDSNQSTVTFRPATGQAATFPLVQVEPGGKFGLGTFVVEGFGAPDGSGGAIFARGDSVVEFRKTSFRNNFAGENGGAVFLGESARGRFYECRFEGNRAGSVGGAITIEGSSDASVRGCTFTDNTANVFGCDINVASSVQGGYGALRLLHSTLSSGCDNVLVENPFGRIYAIGNTFSHPTNGIDSTDLVTLFGNIFNIPDDFAPRVAKVSDPKTEAMCNDFGTNAFLSLGFNISSDGSCALDQATDQPDTDPMLQQDPTGFWIPQPGSPVIDAGANSVVEPVEGQLAVLPCSYADPFGTGRPQDGDGDGSMECDLGTVELMGSGDVSNGHSGAFFNADRNGEGNYVEVLSNNLALVYTFTFRPDGSGPAWFTGVGNINGNSIVINDLRRPIGTSFGPGFDADDILYSPVGGMSMVFPNCRAGGTGGGVAYSGDESLGYEGLLSRATRISQITGCNFTPSANAGLSGSFFDPARNGEGLIVEWLDNGDVLAIFFTFDTNDNQFWVFGVGTPTGKSVTINALYPSASTVWGSDFDPDDVTLDAWGTFDLTWTDCNNMTFDYDSSVSGYGSASRNYQRVTNLAGTSCPDF